MDVYLKTLKCTLEGNSSLKIAFLCPDLLMQAQPMGKIKFVGHATVLIRTTQRTILQCSLAYRLSSQGFHLKDKIRCTFGTRTSSRTHRPGCDSPAVATYTGQWM